MNNEIKEALDILKGYNGELKWTDTEVSLTSENKICAYYNTGEIWKEKVVPCHIEIKVQPYGVRFMAWEKTYEIKGGHGCSYSKEVLLKELDNYNFSKKEYQYSLFDL